MISQVPDIYPHEQLKVNSAMLDLDKDLTASLGYTHSYDPNSWSIKNFQVLLESRKRQGGRVIY